ncbi:MAG: hypothetical protein ACI9QV_000155 [Methylophagaceae bacterium]|jgi:hypothetical protein
MADNNRHEKRRFSRIPFDAHARINDTQGELYPNCAVIDVSLKGLLLEKPEHWVGQLGVTYHVDLILDEAHLVITMLSTVAHLSEKNIGFECQQVDLDSLVHLRQLLSLNLGDESLLHRELSSLITS